MQNLEHVREILKTLNRIPTTDHGTDFSRIREWSLQGWAKFYRQTIFISEHQDPELKALYHRQCTNYEGRLQVQVSYPGVLNNVTVASKQIFRRIEVDSISKQSESRFNFFVENLLSQVCRNNT